MNDATIWTGWSLSHVDNSLGNHGHQKRHANRAKQRKNAELALLTQLDKLQPGSSTGQPSLQFSQELLAELEQWQWTDPQQISHIKHLRTFLRRGLVNGQQALHWQIVLPPPVFTLPAISNPLTPQACSSLPSFRKQIQLFVATLYPTWSGSQREQVAIKLRWGQFLFSSAALGGLLDAAAWLQLPFCQDKVQRWQDQVWFELFTEELPGYVQAKRAPRHWFPDPVSLILFKHLPPAPLDRCHDRDSTRRWVYGCLQDFLTYLSDSHQGQANAHSLPRRQLHQNIEQWLCDATTYWQLILPPFLIEHSRGQSGATAWTTSCWHRILEKKCPPPTKTHEVPFVPASVQAPIKVTQVATGEQIQQLYNAIKKALHHSSKQPDPTHKTVHHRLRPLKEGALEISIVIGGLLDWILSRYSKKEIVRSTAYQELTSLGRSLLAELDETILADMEAADFETVYEAILDHVPSPNTRRQKAEKLRRYHLHMMQLAGWPRLYFSIDGLNGAQQADANILTEEEYQCLYSALQQAKGDPYCHIKLILLILGFRCGLRISEARGLRLEDIHYRGTLGVIKAPASELGRLNATLLVRRSPFSRLKTDNAKRQLPLSQLLANHELAELLSYHQQQRHRTGAQRGRYLFASEASNCRPIDLELVQPALHHLMRQVTGDHEMRYHHLRHSFATHLVQLFTGHHSPLTLPSHWATPISDDCPVPRLVAHVSPKSELSRKGLFAIAEWIGHANPGTTLCHYVHNLDHLLKDNLWTHSFEHRRNGIGLARQFVEHIQPARHVADLLGISDENLRQRNSRHGHLMGWVPALLGLSDQSREPERKLWLVPQKIDLQINAQTTEPRTLAQFGFDEWCSFLGLWRQGIAISTLEQIYYLTPDSLPPQLIKLQKLFGRKGARGGKTLVRKQFNQSGQVVLIPVVPRGHQERESARQYYLSIQKLLAKEKSSDYVAGLRYFATHYRTWNNKILWQGLEEERERRSGLWMLIEKLAPHINLSPQTNITRYKHNFGHISLISPQTGRSSHGLYFALLLACITQAVRS